MNALKLLMAVILLLAVALYITKNSPKYSLLIDDTCGKRTMVVKTWKGDRCNLYLSDKYRIYKYEDYFLICSTNKIDTFWQGGNVMIHSVLDNKQKRIIVRKDEAVDIDSMFNVTSY